MKIPYRTRLRLGRAAVVVLIVALVAALLWLCWVLWLGRFVVYSDSGAHLDFSQSSAQLSGSPAQEPPEATVSIYYNEGDTQKVATELAQLSGYYIGTDDLKGGIAAVSDRLNDLPTGTAVLVDVKNGFGEFYYSSNVSEKRNSQIDPEQMDALIDKLTGGKYYAIARVSAFRDYAYGLNHVDDGLFAAGGAYLWSDDMGCYWLNPAREGTVSYLVQITNELKSLGFDEVVFENFCFPDSENYVFTADRHQVLTTAAGTLVTTCADSTFAVSFMGNPSFPLPEGRSRLYVSGIEASGVQAVADSVTLPDNAIYLVFLTQLHDTRFDTYSVLRPISASH